MLRRPARHAAHAGDSHVTRCPHTGHRQRPTSGGHRSRPAAGLALAVAAAGLIAGCGSATGQGNQPGRVASLPDRVASLPDRAASLPARSSTAQGTGRSQGSREPSTGTTSAATRPVLRLDDSQARRAALYNAYSACLLSHGASRATHGMAPAVAVGNHLGILVQQPVPPRAQAACVNVLPRNPPQLQASTNPHFHSESLAYVDCLRRHGEWVRLLNGYNLNWTFVAGHPVPDNEAGIENGCLLQAFAGR